jgi:hypothetical protein
MLCAKANHKATALTFSRPRTTNFVIPRLRAWALQSLLQAACLFQVAGRLTREF